MPKNKSSSLSLIFNTSLTKFFSVSTILLNYSSEWNLESSGISLLGGRGLPIDLGTLFEPWKRSDNSYEWES